MLRCDVLLDCACECTCVCVCVCLYVYVCVLVPVCRSASICAVYVCTGGMLRWETRWDGGISSKDKWEKSEPLDLNGFVFILLWSIKFLSRIKKTRFD